MSEGRSILVLGGTGNIGGAAVRSLVPRGHHVRSLTRNINSAGAKRLVELGVELIEGDLLEPASLLGAVSGMDTVFAVTTPAGGGPEGEVRQGRAIVDAAREAGVGHLIYSSVASAHRNTGIGHFESKYEIEQYLAASGVSYTISGPVFVMDNFLMPVYVQALREGALRMAVPPDRTLQLVSFPNVGAFAAAVVDRREDVFGKRVDIAGDELTGAEIASSISAAADREIKYEGSDPESLRQFSEDMADMFKWFGEVGYEANIDSLRKEFSDVPWESFDQWSKQQKWRLTA